MLLPCRQLTLDLPPPRLMGILNLTPDSFYDGGLHTGPGAALRQAEKMIGEGADIIDLGGMSSRPGADIIPPAEETARILPVLNELIRHFPQTIFSIDTLHAETAEACLQCGAHIINDISGGTFDPRILETAARHEAAFVVMHKKGNPDVMQQNPHYDDVVNEVLAFFTKQIALCQSAGLQHLILDPGFGFGKTVAHNYELLRALPRLAAFGFPVLAGLSRKSMICKPLGIAPAEALNGTTALHTIALLNGANILRVHDVKEARQAVELCRLYLEQ